MIDDFLAVEPRTTPGDMISLCAMMPMKVLWVVVDVVVVVVVVVISASHFVPSYPALQVHCPVESAHCKLLEPVASQPHTENKKINTFFNMQ